MPPRRFTWFLSCCSIAAAGPLRAQRPLNLDFEQSAVSYRDRPWGWSLGWSAFAGGPAGELRLDSTMAHGGRQSLRITVADTVSPTAAQQLLLQVPSGFALGRTLTVHAWLRGADIRGTGQLMLEAWGNQVVVAGDTASIPGTSDWTEHTLSIGVPADATIHSIVLIASLEGKGTAWFDALRLEVDGKPITALPSAVTAPTAAELAGLRTYATPLVRAELVSAGDDRDLRALDRILEGARIVGLGESTHGTREFFQGKHRILEYLVRRHGFRLFAIEANQLAVERINRYVQGGPGTARTVARAMFAVWNTEEVEALIDWIRSYNAEHRADPVRFAGYDMQDHRTPVDSLVSFLSRVEPALVPQVEALTSEYRQQASYATYQVPDSIRLRWAQQADTLSQLIGARKSAWLQQRDREQVEWAVQAATLYRQAARFNVGLNSPERDSLMAVNADWLLRTLAPGAKAVVWAHDVHVSHGGDPERSFNAGAQMGAHLRRQYGDAYRALSLLTYDGSYSATRSLTDHVMTTVAAFPAPAGSMEEALHRLPRPEPTVGWLIDLRAARQDARLAWLQLARPIRHVGYAAYDYGFDLTAILPLEFDGIVFIDRTTASRLLR